MPNSDLEQHAFNKVKRALDDVLQLVDNPEDKFRIALMACGATVGAAGGILKAISERAGIATNDAFVKGRVCDLIRSVAVEGPEAMEKMKEGTNG